MSKIKACLDIIPCWPVYNYQISLQNRTSTFMVQAIQHL